MFSDAGKVIRFAESVVREMGRTARGVRGMKLGKGQQVISMLIPESGAQILTASERGFGKRTPLSKFLVAAVAARASSPWVPRGVTVC